MNRKTNLIFHLGVLLLLIIFSVPTPAKANGLFFVNSASNVDMRDSVLTLREAVRVANGNLLGPFTNAERNQLGGCTFTGSNNAWLISGGCGAGIPDTIGFAGSYTILLTTSLEELTDEGTIISGLTGQNIKIDGNEVATSIFRISGSDITINNLKMYGTANNTSTIWVFGLAQRVQISDNVIGDDDAGAGGCGQSAAAANGIKVNSTGFVTSGVRAWIYGNVIECHENGNGIIVVATDEVIIGEDDTGSAGSDQRNIIRDNGGSGVRIEGGSGNVVRNSAITGNGESGVHITNSELNRVFGNTIASNGDNGVEIVNGAQLNRIGCPTGGYNNATYQNHIHSNTNEGVWLYGALTASNWINCNHIGLTTDGNGAAGNGRSGVFISGGAHGNFVGINTSTRNIISGNTRYGVEISGDNTDNNGVYGNFIGTNLSGSTAMPNSAGVVIIQGAANNHIGDVSNSNQGENRISSNNFVGIFIGDTGTSGNTIEGNRIGSNGTYGIRVVEADGNSIGDNAAAVYQAILENGSAGIILENTNNTFVGPRNIILGNGGAGIAVTGNSVQNDLWPIEIYGNGGPAIDLGNDGPTANDAGDGDSGPNNLLNYPEVTDITGSVVSGTVCGGCTVRVYYVYPGQPGDGGQYITSVLADFAGNWSVDVNDLPALHQSGASGASLEYRLAGRSIQGGGITPESLVFTALQSFNTSEMSPHDQHQVFLPLVLKNYPLPTTPDQVWFVPNMGSYDYPDLFAHPEQWPTARSQIDVFKFYTQNLLDAPCTICGSNTLNAFINVQAFQKLTDWGVAIGVEAGAVKEWGCTGEQEFLAAELIIENVAANGGAVTYLAMDEPYIGGELVANGISCGYTMSQSADATTYFVNQVRSAYPAIILGDIEPYPYFTVAQLQQWIIALESRGVQLDFFHLDVDVERVIVEGHDVGADMWTLREFCQAHGIPFGVIFTSNWTEADSDELYFASTMAWLDTVTSAIGMPAHAIFQSWQGPAPGGDVHAIPTNLPEDDPASHTRLVLEGLGIP